MDQVNMDKYVAVMAEIKRRTEIIDLYLFGGNTSKYKAATIETVGLQFRKVFELIAFASLAAHQHLYAKVYNDFAKHWEAAKLLKNIRRLNPGFYPKPVVEVPTEQPGVTHQLQDREADYLTESELIIAHGKCGSLMHAANPFGHGIDYAYYETSFPVWRSRIINLLNNHQIKLPGDTGFYLVHMQEVGKEGVTWYTFGRKE